MVLIQSVEGDDIGWPIRVLFASTGRPGARHPIRKLSKSPADRHRAITCPRLLSLAIVWLNHMDRIRHRLAAPLSVLATVLFTLPACSPADRVTAGVTIKTFRYAPDPITIRVGDSIKWTNEDPVGHTATAMDDSFDTGLFFRDNSVPIIFETAGTFPYFCGSHPEMAGTVVVEPGE